MITVRDNFFKIDTQNTTYAFRVMETGQLEHLYYGRKIRIRDIEPLCEKHAFGPGNTVAYNQEHLNLPMEDISLEISSYGKGDIREPFLEVTHADGSFSTDFTFDSYDISEERILLKNLPCSYSENGKTEQLKITLMDVENHLSLELFYWVYPECDVISRGCRLTNNGEKELTVNRLMSLQLDFSENGYILTSFQGGWAREMCRSDIKLCSGKHVNASYTGTTSSRANSFIMLSNPHTTEDFGGCYGFHLIYSGNHYEAVEVNSFGKTRLVTGINPQSFSWKLQAGESFEAPEAVMSYSRDGWNGLSQHMHAFVREHIVRGSWKNKFRPVLLNSWEANYFDINEKKLLKLAKAGKEAGIELFVMDDGWFGERNDDTCSLGDWYVNEKKLPGGVKRLSEKINQLGLAFGIWVEPEMVNVNSKLYREHPEWVIDIPGKKHAESRNQRILDLANSEVQDYIIESMTGVFSSGNIAYVKWDMNRIFSDVYSKYLEADRQGEVFHRYVCGLYRCMKELTNRFPEILFEGCSAGGNRFDLGILCYFPQIWASDNTDALCRAEIQTGYSYGYPMSVVSAHVSACPNHQTLRVTPIETRFAVAAFGVFGYECNLCDMKKEDFAAVKAQIELYKKWREVLQFGHFYRGRTFYEGAGDVPSAIGNRKGNILEWTCVSGDQTKAVGMLFQKLVVPNQPYTDFKAKGLDEEKCYHFYNRSLKYSIKDFGDLINTISPIHLKPESLVHNVLAKFVKMEGETEDCYEYGDTLMYHGVKLKQAFAATGYSDEVRHFQDFGSRMYFMEEVTDFE